MAELTRIEMARELVRHASHHQCVASTRLPQFTVNPIPNKDGTFTVLVSPQSTHRNANPYDFNLEIHHCIDDLRSALEYCAFDAH